MFYNFRSSFINNCPLDISKPYRGGRECGKCVSLSPPKPNPKVVVGDCLHCYR